jgi:hypothetical protein
MDETAADLEREIGVLQKQLAEVRKREGQDVPKH